MERILVTGGTGYIGSHTVLELYKQGYEIDILDNLANSKITVLDKIEQLSGKRPDFYNIDLRDFEKLNQLFEKHQYDLVIHFAGLKAVGESVAKPLEYYENNVTGTLNLLKCMKAHQVNKIIFSSSATVYGNQPVSKYDESMPTGVNLSNPYGKTKYMIEEILKDAAQSDSSFSATILRYFNPIGNHESGLLGEDPNGIPNNLMPIIMNVAKGKIPELQVYGGDYDTPDGTCLRDYIHVVDLATGHIAAISKMCPGVSIYNLGTGKATSVLEMVQAFEKVSGQKLPYSIVTRRPGDLAAVCADPSKAERELDWHATHSIEDAMRDTLTFLRASAS
jgi:UDP-glucose 4-epimerase